MTVNIKWGDRLSTLSSDNIDDYRTQYEKDYARIIHSAAFRRLQRKTQVLGLGDGDFYRTRLTHSLEVSQISVGICNFLRRKDQYGIFNEIIPDQSLISSISIAHDIGHPPFGHGGEVALNYMMRHHEGFEGNAHTLNLLTNFEGPEDGNGLNLTRRMLLGIVKYPSTYNSALSDEYSQKIHNEAKNSFRTVKASDWKPPKCIFNKDEPTLDLILSLVDKSEAKKFKSVGESENPSKHKKPKYKSFDCSIMELSDDISYGVHDLEDAIHLKMIGRDIFNNILRDGGVNFNDPLLIRHELGKIQEDLFSENSNERKRAIGRMINFLISSTEIKKLGEFSDNVMDLSLSMNDTSKKFLEALKEITRRVIIKSAEVQTLEYRGQVMIMEIFEAIDSDPERFLSGKTLIRWKNSNTETKRKRAICDYIAGMTDDYATKLYQRLFVPGTSSLFHKL